MVTGLGRRAPAERHREPLGVAIQGSRVPLSAPGLPRRQGAARNDGIGFSLWLHGEGGSVLLRRSGAREDRRMSNAYDTIIIGLGAIGSACLYQLAKRGQRVLGIDR